MLTTLHKNFRKILSRPPKQEEPEALTLPSYWQPAADLQKMAQEILKEHAYEELSKEIKVFWNPLLQTTLGMALYHLNSVTLNPKIADNEEELHRTLRHELAHLIAYSKNSHRRISPHGQEWREACIELGLPEEEPCHDLPIKRRVIERKYHYSCPNPTCQFEIARVKPFKNPVSCAHCCKKYNHGRFSAKYQMVKTVVGK